MKFDITFVMMTCGELAEKDCLAAIQPFRDQISFFEVRNVFPQIKALRQMVDGVQTEYFVALDSDMVLFPDAWDRINNALRHHYRNESWHSILFPLWDTLTERKILALKVMRSKAMKQVLFEESATPDVSHYQALTDAGWTCIHDYLRTRPIGEHRVAGKHFCYFKYRDVYQTYKSHNFEWDSGAFMGGDTLRERAKAHYDFFVYKYLTTDNKDYLHCIAGMMDGILSPVEHKSKNLKDREYKVPTDLAIHEFYHWYMRDEPLKNMENLLF